MGEPVWKPTMSLDCKRCFQIGIPHVYQWSWLHLWFLQDTSVCKHPVLHVEEFFGRICGSQAFSLPRPHNFCRRGRTSTTENKSKTQPRSSSLCVPTPVNDKPLATVPTYYIHDTNASSCQDSRRAPGTTGDFSCCHLSPRLLLGVSDRTLKNPT